ncbi:lysophospholipid acyltransferase family protein [Egicoccus halophilus]|uniref:1-acyl-sn-glycerol-3-phosphate acyltransferase n=1 Tax=Egicoccus halophilus TaxID=1670830 RepID=A0A8J3ESE5_9ACTN|nr:lysophospholipid acyltransferase family protein [Egicoccus halophilus]GGI03001.1 1-acyl-sn-glycerol-3-phosphate acyltransferase [Egicoccus halophilus]
MDPYEGIAAGFRGAWRALRLDIRTVDHDQVPSTGPAILASNHIGYLDFCFVALAPPRPRRRVRFLARHDIFDRRVVGTAMRAMRQIPVDTHGDPTTAFVHAEAALARGDVVGVHPEGTISPSFVPRRGRTGTVRLAQTTGAPIVPVAVWGSQRLLTKWQPTRLRSGICVSVRYGEPWHPPADAAPARATAELMRRIRDLLAREQATYPQQPRDERDRWWLPAHLGGTAPTPEEADARLRAQAQARRAARRGQP